jgi:hypothetical protein
MISDKVHPHHLERKAMLYVRQSSAHQVLHNRESSALHRDHRFNGLLPLRRHTRPAGDHPDARSPRIELLTYADLAERLKCSPEAARSLAKRLRLPRSCGNDEGARQR